jgi:hypothetical protein
VTDQPEVTPVATAARRFDRLSWAIGFVTERMSAPQGRWWVVCAEHSVGPLPDRVTAERRLTEIERLGACMCPHRVEEATL